MTECKFKIGDFVKTGHVRGIVKETSFVKVNPVEFWAIDIEVTYFYSVADRKDVSDQYKLLTFVEKDLKFDRTGRLDHLLK